MNVRGIAIACIAGAILIGVALGVMLLTGYVPTELEGPRSERTWVLLYGVGDGLMVAALFAVFFGRWQ